MAFRAKREKQDLGLIFLIWKEMAKMGQFFPLTIKGVV